MEGHLVDVDLSPLPVIFVLTSEFCVLELVQDLRDASCWLGQHGLHGNTGYEMDMLVDFLNSKAKHLQAGAFYMASNRGTLQVDQAGSTS